MKLRVGYCSRYVLVAVAALLCNFAFAQRTLTGKITDKATGEGLIGANILIVGTGSGTITDFDGSYTLEVPAGSTEIEFSYTGYTTQRITLGSETTLDIQLAAGQLLDEVVVTGYGSQKAREITSSIVTIKNENFNRGNVNNPAQLLQGKVAGLSITRPGGDVNSNFTIRLRGLSTLGANSSPLIVIDGIIGGSLNSVDPNDIENMTVLKDASAAAIYGTRGASGAILITTKKGAAGKTTVDYNSYVSSDSRTRDLPMMTAAEWRNLGAGLPASNRMGWRDNGTETNWLDEVTRNAISHVHNISVGGGTKNGGYRASVNYRDLQNIQINTGRKNLNARLNLYQNALNGKLRLATNLSLNNGRAQYSPGEVLKFGLLYNPTAPVLSSNPADARWGGYFEEDLFDYNNPVSIANQNVSEGDFSEVQISFQADYDLFKGFTLSALYAQQRDQNNTGFYSNRTSRAGGGFGNQGSGNVNYSKQNTHQATFTGTYAKDLGKLDLKLTGGYEYQYQGNEGFGFSNNRFLTDVTGYNNIGSGLGLPLGLAGGGSGKSDFENVAVFGRVNLNLDDTYFMMASLRREGNSRFGEGNKYAVFPAISAGADLTKAFGLSFVDNLKFRAAYGIAGNLPPNSNLSQELVGPGGRFFYNGQFVPSYGPQSNPNPNLKWEKTAEFTVGFDFAALNYKLNGSLEYFNRNTQDLLFNAPVPVPPNLVPNTLVNVGELENSGIELALNFPILKKEKFSWDVNLANTVYTSNKLISLSNEDFDLGKERFLANVGSPGLNNNNMIYVADGQPLGQIYGPVYRGVAEDGKWQFEDLNGDGKYCDCPDDQKVIGDGIPDMELGFGNNLRIGKFDVNLFFRGVFGHDLVNQYRIFYEPVNTMTWNRVNSKYFNPKLTDGAKFSSHQVEAASFFKLDNATVGYNFDLPSGSAVRSINLYVSGQNLIVLSGYTGSDPEARLSDSEQGGSGALLSPGIDRRSTPFMQRNLTFGVRLGL
jgi:TonB-dependent starch-binding outer membrane protein SusC